MKPTLLILLSAFCIIACSQGNSDKLKTVGSSQIAKDSSIYVYHFQNKYLDLTSLKFRDSIFKKNYIEIKKEGLYAPDFMENADSAIFKNRTFKVIEKKNIAIYENGKYLKTISNPDKKTPLDNLTGNSIIFSSPAGIIHILRLNEEAGYHIKKYDCDGNLLNEWKIAHTLFKRSENEVESIPFLYYRAHTNKEIIFSSLDYDKPTVTVILNIISGEEKKIDFSTAGMILDENNDSLVGIIMDDSTGKKFNVEINNKTWQIDNPGYNNSVRTILKDGILVVAIYDNISTGCSMDAYNASTGKLIWNGDVKQMMVAHSKYYNIVHLTLFRDKLILQGDEAYGSYLQVIDFKTGKRLFASMP